LTLIRSLRNLSLKQTIAMAARDGITIKHGVRDENTDNEHNTGKHKTDCTFSSLAKPFVPWESILKYTEILSSKETDGVLEFNCGKNTVGSRAPTCQKTQSIMR